MEVIVEEAKKEDIQAILDIYNYAIIHTTATFDTEVKTMGEMERWYERFENPLHPLLVARIDGKVVGYASLNPFKEKDAYKHTVENSIYVHPDYFRKGIASRLLEGLIFYGDRLQHRNIIAVITEGNETSIRLHEKFGFIYKGTLQGMGYKGGNWLSISYYQLSL